MGVTEDIISIRSLTHSRSQIINELVPSTHVTFLWSTGLRRLAIGYSKFVAYFEACGVLFL